MSRSAAHKVDLSGSNWSKSTTKSELLALLPYLTKRERDELDSLLLTMEESERNLIRLSSTATPEVVEAFAHLTLKDDHGNPIKPAAHHRLWLEFICDERVKKLLIIAPPESAKTTWVISAYLGVKVGMFPKRSFIVSGVTDTVAEKRTAALRDMTQDPAWQSIFPDVTRSKTMTWSPTEWSLGNGRQVYGRLHPTMAAYGLGGSITGSRADEIVCDDLLDFDNTRTGYQRALAAQWFHNSLLTRRKSRIGRVIVIGTAWHQDDLYQHLKQDGDWLVVHTPLLSDGPGVYAEVRYPSTWEHELLGEPVNAGTIEV